MVDAPPTLVEAVAECIDPRWLVKPANGVLRLVEKLEKRANMWFEVVDPPVPMAVIRMEKVGHLPGVREGRLKKICDYLLIARIGGQIHAVFIEMKKILTHEEHPKEQLVRSLPILRYLQSMCTVEYGFSDSASQAKTSFWIVGKKRSARIDKPRVHADPQEEIDWVFHKGFDIATFVGPRLSFAALAKPKDKGPRGRRHA